MVKTNLLATLACLSLFAFAGAACSGDSGETPSPEDGFINDVSDATDTPSDLASLDDGLLPPDAAPETTADATDAVDPAQEEISLEAEGRLKTDLTLQSENGVQVRIPAGTLIADGDGIPVSGTLELAIESATDSANPDVEDVDFLEVVRVVGHQNGEEIQLLFIGESDLSPLPTLHFSNKDDLPDGAAYLFFMQDQSTAEKRVGPAPSDMPRAGITPQGWDYHSMEEPGEDGVSVPLHQTGRVARGVIAARELPVPLQGYGWLLTATAPFQPIYIKLVEAETAEMLAKIPFEPGETGPKVMGAPGQEFWVSLQPGSDGTQIQVYSRFANRPQLLALPRDAAYQPLQVEGPFEVNGDTVGPLLENPYIEEEEYAGLLQILVFSRYGSFTTFRSEVNAAITEWTGGDRVVTNWHRGSGSGYAAKVTAYTRLTGLAFVDASGPAIINVTERTQTGRLMTIRIEHAWEDPQTQLMWHNHVECGLNWDASVSYCDGLEADGYTDWRLPTIEELRTLYLPSQCPSLLAGGACPVQTGCLDTTCRDYDLCGTYSCNDESSTFSWRLMLEPLQANSACGWNWSSSAVGDAPGQYWGANFHNRGNILFLSASDQDDIGARCVRP